MEPAAGQVRGRVLEGALFAIALLGVGALLAVGALWVLAPSRFVGDQLVGDVFRTAVMAGGAGVGLAALVRRNLLGAGLGALAALAALLPGELARYALPVALAAIGAAGWPGRRSGLEWT
jgi:hypothetical protein